MGELNLKQALVFVDNLMTTECQVAFETVINKLMTAPILGFTDPKLPYILHTDASTVGLGAALY